MPAPTNLIATGIDDDTIALAWDVYAGASGYDIERDGVIIVEDHPTNSYTDNGLATGTSYDYRVRAKLDTVVLNLSVPTYTNGTTRTATSADHDMAKPSVVVGDILCFYVWHQSAATISITDTSDVPLTGWTTRATAAQGTSSVVVLIEKVIDGTEPATIRVKMSASTYTDLASFVISGSAGHDTSVTSNGSGSAMATGTLDTALENELLVILSGHAVNGMTVPYTGFTQVKNWDGSLYIYTKSQAALGATGTFSATAAGSAAWAVVMAAYKGTPALLTGGAITAPGDGYVYHTFTTSGTLTPIGDPVEVEYLTVAGGGGGGDGPQGGYGGGGGGAGGLRQGTATVASAQTVTIGGGGAGGTSGDGTKGTDSSLGAISGEGGGYGAMGLNGAAGNGGSGGSGGGSRRNGTPGTATAGQGSNGGSGLYDTFPYSGGGGGGAGEVGSTPGDGGDGVQWPAASGIHYAGGGGAGSYNADSAGGLGGGGAGGGSGAAPSNGEIGTANTGGGGGAGGVLPTGGSDGAAGGSGIIKVRYPVDYAWTGQTPIFIDANESAWSDVTTSLVLTTPTGAVASSWLIAYLGVDPGNTDTIATPSGWTLIASGGGGYLFARQHDGSSGTYTFTKTGTANYVTGIISAYANCGGVDVGAISAQTFSGTPIAPSVTVTVADSLSVVMHHTDTWNDTGAAPTGYTSRSYIQSASSSSRLADGDTPLATGATGTVAFGALGTNRNWVAAHVVLKGPV